MVELKRGARHTAQDHFDAADRALEMGFIQDAMECREEGFRLERQEKRQALMRKLFPLQILIFLGVAYYVFWK